LSDPRFRRLPAHRGVPRRSAGRARAGRVAG
jgi:hypothetical protein